MTLLKCPISLPRGFNTGRNVIEFILEQVRIHSNKSDPFWMIESVHRTSLKYEDVDRLSRNLASNLHALGLQKGDVVIYASTCYVKTHTFLAGLWRANGIARASYTEDTAETIRERVMESKSKILFCDPEYVKTCIDATQDLPYRVHIISSGACQEQSNCLELGDLLKDHGKPCPSLQMTADDPAVILNTSGTTGKSKGALWTHRGVLALAGRWRIWPRLETVMCSSKPTHISGFGFPLFYLLHGAKVIHTLVPTPQHFCEAVEEYKPQCLFAFPTYLLSFVNYDRVDNYDLSSLIAFFTGGMLLREDVKQRFLKFKNITCTMNLMGMTETNFNVSDVDFTAGGKPATFETPPGATGKVMPGTMAKVIDSDSEEALGPHTKGELCFKNDATMKEYINNPVATANTFTKDGFLRSGDIAYYDESEFIYICGRAKEVFKYYNNHISPSELDEVIGQHEAVNDVCTIGISDPEGGDTIPRAFVTIKTGFNATSDEIREFANARLASYKHLRGGLFIIDDIPKGTTGKISRKLTEEMSKSRFPH